MADAEVQIFIRRAEDFLEAMRFLRESNEYRNSAALLAVHSAISYSDALRTGLGGASLSSEDHGTAVRALRSLLSPEQTDGLQHLQQLLAKKSAIAYGKRRLGEEDFEAAFNRAERFARWVNRIGAELRVGGWRDAG